MRVIDENNLLMTKRKNGTHDVVDLKCNDINEAICFRFGAKGEIWHCQRFRRMPTGVKICAKE